MIMFFNFYIVRLSRAVDPLIICPLNSKEVFHEFCALLWKVALTAKFFQISKFQILDLLCPGPLIRWLSVQLTQTRFSWVLCIIQKNCSDCNIFPNSWLAVSRAVDPLIICPANQEQVVTGFGAVCWKVALTAKVFKFLLTLLCPRAVDPLIICSANSKQVLTDFCALYWKVALTAKCEVEVGT